MKILMINTTFSKGGAAQVARMLHHTLNEVPGLFSYFAYGRGPKVENERTFKFAYRIEVHFHVFLTRIMGLQGYGSYLSTRQLEKIILKEKFDLIHLHNLHGYYVNLNFIKFLERLSIPIIWTLHDGWPITGRCSYWLECNRWKTGCGNCSNLSWYPKTYFDSSHFMWGRKKEYFTSEWNPTIVCPSQWLADKIKESYLSKYRVEVIQNAIDTEIFKPKEKISLREKLGISSEKKVILFAAVDLKEERKGARYFFKALQYINVSNWMVLIIGKEMKFNEEIKSISNIKQLGYISDQNLLSQIYSAADIFCVSSLDDNFPATVLESMACGTPVVGFKVGGIPEQVEKNCGVLVASKDSEALGKALRKLIVDKEMREEFSINSRRGVLENYTIEKFRDRYIKLYKELLT